MTSHAHQPDIYRPGPLLGWLGGAAVAGAAAGLAVAVGAGWGEWGLGSQGRGALMAGIAWGVAGVFGAAVTLAGAQRQIERLGLAVMAASMMRMLLALTLGLAFYFLLRPEGRGFWTCFLLAGLLGLAAETMWALMAFGAANRAASGLVAGVR